MRDLFGIVPETAADINTLYPIERAAIERQNLGFPDDEEDDIDKVIDEFADLFNNATDEPAA